MGGHFRGGASAVVELVAATALVSRLDLSARPCGCRLADASRTSSDCFVANYPGPRVSFCDFRQYPVNRARFEAGWLRLGISRVRRWVWGVDDLVRFLLWCSSVQHVSRITIGRAVG